MGTTAGDLDRRLNLLQREVDRLNRRIAQLSAEQWEQPSNCPGWRVADLVMHVVRNGEAFLQFSQRILAGEDAPAFGFAYPDANEAALAGPDGTRRDVEIRNLGPDGCAALQAEQMHAHAALLRGLSEGERSKTGLWANCHRTAPWGCRQRLAEVAYHHWDLRCSLGEEAPVDEPLARELLAYRLEPAASPLFRYRPADGAPVQVFRLHSTSDDSAWRVSVSADAVPATELGWEPSPRPRPGRRLEPDSSSHADVELAAGVGWLALAVAGRGNLNSVHFRLTGPSDAEQSFRAAFAT